MATDTWPLAVPEDLGKEVRRVSKSTGLSISETMRQSMRLGLSRLEESLSTGLKPFTKEEAKLAFQTPNPEFDDLERHCARIRKRQPRE